VAVIEIREERPEDLATIRAVNQRAFEQDQEANIVDALRVDGGAMLSLVAIVDGVIAGHILYSPIEIGGLTGAALGPMAVLPTHQRQGIGSRLVEAGTDRLARAGVPAIVVVGHPEFYPRFGFKPASQYGVRCEWPVPDDVFMMLVLDETRMAGVTGLAKYRSEFSTIG
jgi:putative acetyltransferase